MEKEISLIWKKRSSNSIAKIYYYIAKNNPQNAEAFIRRMYCFGQSLTVLPDKYAPCRFEKFANRGYHCAVFEKKFYIPISGQSKYPFHLQYYPYFPFKIAYSSISLSS